MTDTIDSHTDASGEPLTETGSGSGSSARTATATLERPASAPASPYPIPAPVPRAGALPTASEQAQAAKDKTLTSPAAVELARRALEEITDPITVGEYLAAAPSAERLVTHLFDCTLSGYRGWHWAVTLSRVPRSRTATVCEMELLPGEEALLAPAWIPWADRLEPGDVTRSDRLPRKETDERLEPGWEATGEDADAVAVDQLDLGRPRVLSAQGVSSAAERWYGGDHGPDAEGVRKAHATCSTCGFFLPMAGALRAIFGVCANEWATDDGSVVSLDHGCGAHSETDLPDQGPEWPISPSRVDDHLMVPLSTNGLDLREGRTIAELAAQQADDGSDVENDSNESDDADDDVKDSDSAPAPDSEAEPSAPSAQDTDRSVDAANDGSDSDSVTTAEGTEGTAATDGASDSDSASSGAEASASSAEAQAAETPSKTKGKSAAKRARRASSSTKRRRGTADSSEEAAEERRSRVLGLDLEELARTASPAASASSASDAAVVIGDSTPSADDALSAAVEAASAPASAGSGDTPSERAASARAAVAGLSLALGIDVPQEDESADVPDDDTQNADADAHHAPRTLAELEAILPNRS
ncbi:DUF3027 domain-containing protein [Actinomyces viscosus]|uniref:DUF3027 domain-containing protein n=1 Tax=Actinomyces viscosus TaxID=1656 RepID=UPI0028E92581|nr:DUF3027 domain-containing protein [Actinomyces viscosus]